MTDTDRMSRSEVPAETMDLPERITLPLRSGPREVAAVTIVPGLAITEALGTEVNEGPIPRRYVLTHVPSGRTAHAGSRCAHHIRILADVATTTGIDWTQGMEVVASAAQGSAAYLAAVTANRRCDRHCPGEPPIQPSWSVRCRTCDWQWDPDDDPGEYLDAEAALRMARDHECEPWVEIAPPDGGRWVPPSCVNKDGTIRDLGAKTTQAEQQVGAA